MPGEAVSRIVALIKRVGPLPGWPKTDAKKLFALMHADKKTRGGKVRFVLAARLGEAASYDDVPGEMVECVLRCAPKCLQRPVVEIVDEATGKRCG
jgi:3-dehydroquinate synthetase